jgi:hypothetical protein
VDGTGAASTAWSELRSPALAVAVRELAAVHRLTTAMTLRSLVALVLGLRHNRRDVALRCIVATRFRPEYELLVAAFNQNALCRLAIGDESQAAFFAFHADLETAAVTLIETGCGPLRALDQRYDQDRC